MESPQRVPSPPPYQPPRQVLTPHMTRPTTISWYFAWMQSRYLPEFRYMRHPTLYQHHPYMLALTSCRDAHPGRPYLAVLGTTLCPITRHRAGQYCTTEIRTVSRHLCLITTHRAKSRKIAKCHILYTPNYPILPCLSASFTSALTLHIDTNWKSAIYASSKHNVHNVTHKSVKQKVPKSNKVSHHVYHTDLLVMDHLPMWCHAWCLDGLKWRVLHPMNGASGACFAHAGLPSRTQKCDAYCHNFMRPRRSTRPTIVTETCSFFHSNSSICSHIMKYYSRLFNFAEYYSMKCIIMQNIVPKRIKSA